MSKSVMFVSILPGALEPYGMDYGAPFYARIGLVGNAIASIAWISPFSGSGDDLCFHTYGKFSSSPSSSYPLSPQPPSPYLSLKAHIPALLPKSQSSGPNSSLEARIPVLRLNSQRQCPYPNPKALIHAARLKS